MKDLNINEMHEILGFHIYKSYNMSIDEFSRYLGEKYIKDKKQREVFNRKGAAGVSQSFHPTFKIIQFGL